MRKMHAIIKTIDKRPVKSSNISNTSSAIKVGLHTAIKEPMTIKHNRTDKIIRIKCKIYLFI